MRRCALLRCSTHPRLLACLLHIMGSPSRLYLTPRCYGWDVCILPTGLGCFVALAPPPPPRTMAAGRAGLPPLPAGGHWAHHHWGICWLVSLSLPSHCLPRRDRYSSGRAGLEDMLLATPSPRCSDCPGHEGLHWSLVVRTAGASLQHHSSYDSEPGWSLAVPFQALPSPHLLLIFRGHLLYLEAVLFGECPQWNTVLLVFSLDLWVALGPLQWKFAFISWKQVKPL